MPENNEKNTGIPHLQQQSRFGSTLIKSPEGRILLSGIAIAFIFTLWLAVMMLVSPEQSQYLVGMTATQVMFGRAAGMALGYTLGLSNTMVITVCMILETTMVLIVFPMFVFSWRHLLVIRWLRRFFDKTQKTAEARKALIQKYGIIGLFIFVWFPFWMTGPVIGSVIGFLLGLKLWINMSVVLAGTYVAILGWAFFLKHFHDKTAQYSSYAAMVLMVLLVAMFFLGHLLHKTLWENRKKSHNKN